MEQENKIPLTPIDITSEEVFVKFCQDKFPGKKYLWHPGYCFIQAGDVISSNRLHYEFYQGKMHLHIEDSDWRGIRDYLKWKSPIGKMSPRHWGRNECDWVISTSILSEEDLYNAFLEIRDIMGYHIHNYEAMLRRNPTSEVQNKIEGLESEILPVEDLLEEPLSIPHYQRPYRWEEENVRKLLTDVLNNWSANKSRYRIGSVILHDNQEQMDIVDGQQHIKKQLDIVDGQQRITTILLILKACGIVPQTKVHLRYNHSDSFTHITNNFIYIKDWLEENIPKNSQKDFAQYLLRKCEMVKIVVKDLSEAFQMFDSQNGRGKDLEAYNLLKAYHIRAMEQNSMEEKIRCDQRWEEATQYEATPLIDNDLNIDILKQIFDEQLYRTRLWSKGKNPGKFSKKKIDEFKGFTIDKNHPTLYPYQNPHLLQYLTAKFYQYTLEGTIATSNRFELGDSDNINPFVNINQTIVNGKSFFDYVETYVELYKQLFLNLGSYQLSEFKRFYYAYCLNYECPSTEAEIDRLRKKEYAHIPKGGATRTGDGYLRELYKSLILVVFDKFGERGLNRYYKILYRLVYMARLRYSQVRYKTVDKMPQSELGDCFAIITQAKDLADLRLIERKMYSNLSTINNPTTYDMGQRAQKVKNFILKGDYGN